MMMDAAKQVHVKHRLEGPLRERLRTIFNWQSRQVLQKYVVGKRPSVADSEIHGILRDHYKNVGATFGFQLRNEMPEDVSMTYQEALEYMAVTTDRFDEQAAEQSTHINDTTIRLIEDAVRRVEDEAEKDTPKYDIAKEALKMVMARNVARANAAACYETQWAAEYAKHVEAAILYGAPLDEIKASAVSGPVKQWNSVGDSRVREWHIKADGIQVAAHLPFTVGGEKLMYPGDASLGASSANLINCRCSADYNVESIASARQDKATFVSADDLISHLQQGQQLLFAPHQKLPGLVDGLSKKSKKLITQKGIDFKWGKFAAKKHSILGESYGAWFDDASGIIRMKEGATDAEIVREIGKALEANVRDGPAWPTRWKKFFNQAKNDHALSPLWHGMTMEQAQIASIGEAYAQAHGLSTLTGAQHDAFQAAMEPLIKIITKRLHIGTLAESGGIPKIVAASGLAKKPTKVKKLIKQIQQEINASDIKPGIKLGNNSFATDNLVIGKKVLHDDGQQVIKALRSLPNGVAKALKDSNVRVRVWRKGGLSHYKGYGSSGKKQINIFTNRTVENVVGQTVHEVGHAIDDVLGQISRTNPDFIAAYKKDVANLPLSYKRELEYFLDPDVGAQEAFAEAFAQGLTTNGSVPTNVHAAFQKNFKNTIEAQRKIIEGYTSTGSVPQVEAVVRSASRRSAFAPASESMQSGKKSYEWREDADRRAFQAHRKEKKATKTQALNRYIGSGYIDMNGVMRTGQGPESAKRAVAQLKKQIAASRLQNDATLYRGVKGRPGSRSNFHKLKVGDTFQDQGFSSWSSHEAVANSFSQGGGRAAKPIIFRMKALKGDQAAYVGRTIGEYEYIYNAGSKYEVVDIEDGIRLYRDATPVKVITVVLK